MSSMTTDYRSCSHSQPMQEWRSQYDRGEWGLRHSGGSSGLLLGTIAVLGLGALAWYYLGPDLMRYLKIRNM